MPVIDCTTGATRQHTVQELAAIAAAASPVPEAVTPRQMRLALLQQGLMPQVATYVAAQSQAVQIAWEYASEVLRNDALIAAAATALGLTTQQGDDLFRLAASL